MALSANASLDLRNARNPFRHSTVVKTAAIIFQNSMVVVDITAGTSKVAANETTTQFIGIAIESSTGTFPLTGLADGSVTVETITNVEVNFPLKTVVTQANVFGLMFAFDDADITDLTTRGPSVGILFEFVAANDGWVWIGNQAAGTAAV